MFTDSLFSLLLILSDRCFLLKYENVLDWLVEGHFIEALIHLVLELAA